jgi:hypothetical protein
MMTKTNEVVPEEFVSHRQKMFQRTVILTKSAIEYLEKQQQKVTLKRIVEVTKLVDPEGKGISEKAVVSNPEAHKIFQKHSTFFKDKRRRNPHNHRKKKTPEKPSGLTDEFKGLHRGALLKKLEEVIEENKMLKKEAVDSKQILREYKTQNETLSAVVYKLKKEGKLGDEYLFWI